MIDIQKARDVLAKWRDEAASPLPWTLDDETGAVDDAGDVIVGLASREVAGSAYLYPGDDRLIVGTAGNPDLLDAIDELLAVRPSHAHFVAAAIIAADERMSA